VLVLTRLHEGPAVVGLLWGISGAAALVSSLLVGRMRVQGREPRLILAALAINALSYALLPLAAALAVVVASVLLLGIATGPFDIAVFTLRQRRTDPAWFGRVFAVSMSLNSLGYPIGSALAGPLITRSLGAALWVAVAATVAAMLFPLLVIPAED
jgi:predicted MFS family arabinose efflux permease